jgi:hypothetical protein
MPRKHITTIRGRRADDCARVFTDREEFLVQFAWNPDALYITDDRADAIGTARVAIASRLS